MKKICKSCFIIFVLIMISILLTSCVTANVKLDKNGSGSLELYISKNELETDLNNKISIENKLQKRLDELNTESGSKTMLKMNKLSEEKDGYKAEIKFRRIDKIKGIGEFQYNNYADAIKEGSIIRSNIKNLYKGNHRSNTIRNYNGRTGVVEIESNLTNELLNIPIKSISTKSGNEVTVDEVLGDEKLNNKGNVFFFRLLDIENLTKLTLKVDGNIKYISSKNVKIIDKNTVEITPFNIMANLKKSEEQVNDDGSISYITKTYKDVNISTMTGYIIFEEGVNLPLILGLLALGIGLTVLIILGFKKKWFKTFLKSKMVKRIIGNRNLYIMLIPGLILAGVFLYAPMFGLSLAFKDYNPTDGIIGSEWVGFKYFIELFSGVNNDFYRVMRNTVYISLIKFLVCFPITILFALLLNELVGGKFKKTIQTISYLPQFLSWVIIGGMMFNLLSVENGVINKGLEAIGLAPVHWYAEPDYWWGILTITALWKGLGWGTIIYIASMTSVNTELYEACTLDGGGRIRQITTVTIPCIMPVIMLQLILSMGKLLKDDFEQILALTSSGSQGGNSLLLPKTSVIGSLIFDSINTGTGYSQSTALGLIQSVIGLLLVWITNRIVKKSDNEGLW